MPYLILAILALISFGIWGFSTKLATAQLSGITTTFITYVSCTILVTCVFLYNREPLVMNKFTVYAAIAGATAGLASIFYAKACAKGPVSIIAPISGLYILLPTLLGLALLHEEITTAKIAGIILASIAVFLLAR